MNQDLTQELAQAQAELVASKEATARAEAKIAAVQAELNKPTPWARWKPGVGGAYFSLWGTGRGFGARWYGNDEDQARYDFGNCFKTREAAERHAKRIRSMVPTCPVPEAGEKVWVAEYHGSHIPTNWGGAAWQVAAYNLGRIKPTKDDADAWSEEFADAWTTQEDAS